MIQGLFSLGKKIVAIGAICSYFYMIGMDPCDLMLDMMSDQVNQPTCIRKKLASSELSYPQISCGKNYMRSVIEPVASWLEGQKRFPRLSFFVHRFMNRHFREQQDPADREENRFSPIGENQVMNLVKTEPELVTPGMVNELIGSKSEEQCQHLYRDQEFHHNLVQRSQKILSGLTPKTLHNLFYPVLAPQTKTQGWFDWIGNLLGQQKQVAEKQQQVDEEALRKERLDVAYQGLLESLKDYCCSEQRNLENITTLAKVAFYRLFDKNYFPQHQLSQSQYHLLHTLTLRNYSSWFWGKPRLAHSGFCSYYSKWYDDPKLRNFFRVVVQREKWFACRGYITLLHSQSRSTGFILHLYSRFWAMNNRTLPREYLFPFITRNNQVLLDEADRRELLVSGSYKRDNYANHYITKSLIFSNYALLASLRSPLDNPGAFFMRNDNIFGCRVGSADVFSSLNLDDDYASFKYDFDKLSCQYNGLSKYGHLLMIAIPKSIASSSAYVTNFKGRRRPIRLKIDNSGADAHYNSRADSDKVIDAICQKGPQIVKEKDVDDIQFCIPATHDRLLNPYSGIKVVSLEATDGSSLAGFNRMLNSLFSNVKTRHYLTYRKMFDPFRINTGAYVLPF